MIEELTFPQHLMAAAYIASAIYIFTASLLIFMKGFNK